MSKYFYQVIVLMFDDVEIEEDKIKTGGSIGELVSSRIIDNTVTPFVQEFIEVVKKKGHARRALYYGDDEEPLGDVFVYPRNTSNVLALYRFEVEEPEDHIFILEENLKRSPTSLLETKRSEVITDRHEFLERGSSRTNQFDSEDVDLHNVRYIETYIDGYDFYNALPFPHNVGLYIEDREKGLGT